MTFPPRLDRWMQTNPIQVNDVKLATSRINVRAAAIESAAVEEDTRAFSTPLWNALKVALGIFAVYVGAATVLATVVFTPGLKLLGFFVSLSMMTAVGMPMLLATISVAAEDAGAQPLLDNSDEHERSGT